jgi:rod shape-determining protein MreC
MMRKPQLLAIGVALLAALLLLNLPTVWSSQLKLAVSGFFLPLFGLAGSAQKLGDHAGMRALPKGILIADLEQVRRENEDLKLKLLEAQEVSRENEVLRSAVSWQPRFPWKRRLARVISRDPANWWRTLQIDVGTKDGVGKDFPVVTPAGLVGRVDDAGLFSSRVVLLGDPKCNVAAVVDNRTRDKGMIVPGEATILDESIVEMSYLLRNSEAIPGQKVFTSGLGGKFPAGIPIGEIIQTNSVQFGLYLEARVKLSADLAGLEEVWVLTP